MGKFIFLITAALSLVTSCFAQLRIGTGKVEGLYSQHCKVCHGKDLNDGLGGSLLDRESWKIVGKEQTFLEYVQSGNTATGMPAFEAILSRPQIRALEIYINEQRQMTEANSPVANTKGVYSAGGYNFRLQTVVDDLDIPWSIAFMPNGGILIAERPGSVRLFEDGVLHPPVEGTPKVWAKGQGGMMEIAPHPDFRDNGWIYLAYSEAGEEEDNVGMTKVVRGRVIDNIWMDEEVVFEAPEETFIKTSRHFGTRLVFKEGYLYFSIGDRGIKDNAQDLTLPNGKIHRIHDDGRIPKDNPFVDSKDAFPTIWTYGNRNPQGLDLHPLNGGIWESEHGPRGGDEVNLIERGENYGWPVITYGMNYNGTPITEKTGMEGMEQPKLHWTPSIAVCGIDFYEGDIFPEWKYDLFAGGLASQELHRLEIENGEVVGSSVVMKDAGRVRDVASGPGGYLYLVLNGPDRVVRLTPVE